MARRGISVDVTKTVSSQVFFVLDDADLRFKDWFDADGKVFCSMDALKAVARKEAENIDRGDWDDYEAEYDVAGVGRCDDADEYEHFDLSTLSDKQVADMTAALVKERAWYESAAKKVKAACDGAGGE